MRVAIISLAVLGVATNAFAADLDNSFIRGSAEYEPGTPSYYNWSGFYVGGQVGYGDAAVNFGNGVGSLVAAILQDTAEEQTFQPSSWTILSNKDTTAASYGVFAGYNSQWEDVVLGLELNYNHTSLNTAATGSMSRWGALSGYTDHITVSGSSSMNITDYGSLRGRFGYVFGRFLPYATFGVAAGRAEVSKSATVIDVFTDANNQVVPNTGYPYPGISSSVAKVAFPWGWVAGAGVDVMLMPGFFLRAEYEFLQFGTFNDVSANIQTVRVGAAVKY